MALTDAQNALIALKKLAGESSTFDNLPVGQENKPSGITATYSSIFASAIPTAPEFSSGVSLIDGTNTATPGGTYQGALHTAFHTDTTGTIMYVRLPFTEIDLTNPGASGLNQGHYLSLPSNFQALALAGQNTQTKTQSAPFSDDAALADSVGKLQLVPPSFGDAFKVRVYRGIYSEVQAGNYANSTWMNPANPLNWYFDYYSGVMFIGDPSQDEYGTGDVKGKFYAECALYVGDFLSDKDTSAPGAPGEIAKQKLFNAYTFNETATFLEYSGSSFSNDQPSSYWKVPTSCILGSEMIHVNGLLQDSSSRGIGEASGEVNDYLIYESGSNFGNPTGSETVIELSYRALGGAEVDPHHAAKVKITYLQKDE